MGYREPLNHLGPMFIIMRTIYIDADACSVKNTCYKVVNCRDWQFFVVANQYIQPLRNPMITCITVDLGDVVITNDLSLVALCLDKGARVLGFVPKRKGV